MTTLLKDAKVVFITDPDFPRNKEFVELANSTSDAVLINYYTMDLPELMFMAKNRVLPAYTILIMSGQKIIGRIVNKIPKKTVFKKMLKDLGL